MDGRGYNSPTVKVKKLVFERNQNFKMIYIFIKFRDDPVKIVVSIAPARNCLRKSGGIAHKP